MSDVPMPEDTGDFRLINRKVVEALKSMPEAARYIRGMVAWVGFKQVPLEYERKERFAGKTHYTFEKMLRLALDGITGFSNRPLRMAFYLGFFMLIFSVFILAYIVFSFFFYDTVRGWASLAFLLTCSQAVQWMLIGLIGEYVGRIYQESKQRPKYLVMEILDAQETR
jgi:dolichol-phosphate mannosyltransferase